MGANQQSWRQCGDCVVTAIIATPLCKEELQCSVIHADKLWLWVCFQTHKLLIIIKVDDMPVLHTKTDIGWIWVDKQHFGLVKRPKHQPTGDMRKSRQRAAGSGTLKRLFSPPHSPPQSVTSNACFHLAALCAKKGRMLSWEAIYRYSRCIRRHVSSWLIATSGLFSLQFPVCQSSFARGWQSDTLSVLDVEMGHTSLCVLGLLREYSTEFMLSSQCSNDVTLYLYMILLCSLLFSQLFFLCSSWLICDDDA